MGRCAEQGKEYNSGHSVMSKASLQERIYVRTSDKRGETVRVVKDPGPCESRILKEWFSGPSHDHMLKFVWWEHNSTLTYLR